ncbi:hypothetical protein FSP39_008019 [Pinctada imbricata]|uniref:CWH43-like N-terminal domain-containing protein n=1 Tax=Pinctada imbricata TaxID=66713 RepID=A0AA89BZ28_PINIB|nr:hypothetical protein FSP39_008019 [Pinctada imbricata]
MKTKIKQDPDFGSDDKLAPGSDPDDSQIPGCFGCMQRRLHFLPIITTTWLGVAFIITYTATGDPERTIFSQFVNIGAVLLFSNGFIRYLHNKKIFVTSKEERRWHIVNLVALCLMITSSIGLSMVGNFPTSVEKVPHYLGAFLAFGFGVAYCWVQTKISWRMKERRLAGQDRSRVPLLQFINCICSTVFNSKSLTLSLVGISAIIYKARKSAGDPTETGYLRGVYLLSTISEWLLAISYSTFILTFIPLFSGLKLKAATVEIKDSENHNRKNDVVMPYSPMQDEK